MYQCSLLWVLSNLYFWPEKASTALPDTDMVTRHPGCHVLIAKTSSLPRLASKPTKPHVPHFFPAVARFLPANPRLSRLMCPACSPCPAHPVPRDKRASLVTTYHHKYKVKIEQTQRENMTNTNTKWYEQYKNTKWVLPVSCSHTASGQERLISYNLPSAT